MRLTGVTITGADESVDPGLLVELSATRPWLEWGILISHKNSGNEPRYPSKRWREMLFRKARHTRTRLAAHLCGEAARGLERQSGYQRVQVNGLGVEAATRVGRTEATVGFRWIVQARNADELAAAAAAEIDIDILIDPSGGRGVRPEVWPAPPAGKRVGFAGGIGPGNIEDVAAELAELPGDGEFWIDMESLVRSDDDRLFDVQKVQDVLRLVWAYVEDR
jgi:hypothetical protein